MRNPLNSVVSQNIVNESMIKELLMQVQNLRVDGIEKQKKEMIIDKIEQLQYSNRI